MRGFLLSSSLPLVVSFLALVDPVISKTSPLSDLSDVESPELKPRFLVFESHAVPNTLQNINHPDRMPQDMRASSHDSDEALKKRDGEEETQHGPGSWKPVPENTAQNRHLANAYSPHKPVKRNAEYCIPAYSPIVCNPKIPYGGCCEGSDCAYDGSVLKCFKYIPARTVAGHEGKHFLIPTLAEIPDILPRSYEECSQENRICHANNDCCSGMSCALVTLGDQPQCKYIQLKHKRSEEHTTKSKRTCGEFKDSCGLDGKEQCCPGLVCDSGEQTCRFANAEDVLQGSDQTLVIGDGSIRSIHDSQPESSSSLDNGSTFEEGSGHEDYFNSDPSNIHHPDYTDSTSEKGHAEAVEHHSATSFSTKQADSIDLTELTQEELDAFYAKAKRMIAASDKLLNISPNASGRPTRVLTALVQPDGQISILSIIAVGTVSSMPPGKQPAKDNFRKGAKFASQEDSGYQSDLEDGEDLEHGNEHGIEVNKPNPGHAHDAYGDDVYQAENEFDDKLHPVYYKDVAAMDDDLDKKMAEDIENYAKQYGSHWRYSQKSSGIETLGSKEGSGIKTAAKHSSPNAGEGENGAHVSGELISDQDNTGSGSDSENSDSHARLMARGTDREDLRKRYDMINRCRQAGDKCMKDEQCCRNLDCQREKETDKYGKCKNMTW